MKTFTESLHLKFDSYKAHVCTNIRLTKISKGLFSYGNAKHCWGAGCRVHSDEAVLRKCFENSCQYINLKTSQQQLLEICKSSIGKTQGSERLAFLHHH